MLNVNYMWSVNIYQGSATIPDTMLGDNSAYATPTLAFDAHKNDAPIQIQIVAIV